MTDPVAMLLQSPYSSALFALGADDTGEELTMFLLHESPDHVRGLPEEVPVDVRAAVYMRSGVPLVVILLRVSGELYETWWNFHNPAARRGLENLRRQDLLILRFIGDTPEPLRTIALPSPVRDGVRQIWDQLEESDPWEMEAFDRAREQVYAEFATVQALWDDFGD